MSFFYVSLLIASSEKAYIPKRDILSVKMNIHIIIQDRLKAQLIKAILQFRFDR